MVFGPDSSQVLYTAPSSPQEVEWNVVETSIYGGPMIPLVQDAANHDIIGFWPKSRSLIFSSDRQGTYSVWAAAFSGNAALQGPVELAHDLGQAKPIGLTRTGTLYYVVKNSEDVYTAEIDAAASRLLSAHQCREALPWFVLGSFLVA